YAGSTCSAGQPLRARGETSRQRYKEHRIISYRTMPACPSEGGRMMRPADLAPSRRWHRRSGLPAQQFAVRAQDLPLHRLKREARLDSKVITQPAPGSGKDREGLGTSP